LAIKNIQLIRVASIEKQTGSDSTITVNICHIDKEVEIRTSIPKDKVFERVKSRETIVNTSDNTAADISGKSDNSAVTVFYKSDYPVLKQSDYTRVNSLGNLYNGRLNTDRELDKTIIELGKSNSIIVNTIRESNNKILDILIEADKVIDILGKSVAINIYNTAEVDPITFNYNIMDLDIVKEKNSIEINRVKIFGGSDSIEAAATLSILSQYNIPLSFNNLGNW
jgi:hypothetical protein